MSAFTVGTTRIEKIHELDLDSFPGTQLLPALDPALVERRPDWFPAGTWDAQGNAPLSVHTWLVRHEGHVILVDTGAGNHKPRPGLSVLDGLDTAFLQRLAVYGVAPEDVDFVLLTHIHADHVGWNTRFEDGRWLPTFPNATIVCSEREWRYAEALAADDRSGVAAVLAEAGLGEPVRTPVAGVFEDSMQPLVESGQIKRIKIDGSEVLPGIRFLPAAGHSIDHAAIALTSQGRVALFGGDVAHHPVEFHDFDLISCFCEFPEAAKASRMTIAEQAAHSGALYCSSHFPLSSAGHVEIAQGQMTWRFAGRA